MTDELNLRSYPDAVPEMFSRPYYITRKEDGCSGTYFINKGEFGVCSRKVHLKESETNGYWRMARKYNIEAALREAFPDMDVALQGEIIGPAVQENKLGLKELEFRAFNLFDINRRMYMDYNKLVEFTAKYNIPMVPPVISGLSFPFTLEELLKLANEQKYPTGGPAEGIVIRPQEAFYSNVLKRAWSGKVLNEKYDNK
jgi:RNA ligase (TIGR02306 family)